MRNRRVSVLGITGLLTVMVSIILFIMFKPEECNKSIPLGFAFLVFSEIVLFSGLILLEFIKGSVILIRTGCGFVIVGYSLLSIIGSLVYMYLNTQVVIWFWAIELIFVALSIILFLVFWIAAKSVNERNAEILKSVANVNAMVDSLTLLKGNSRYGKQLAKLAEDLSFTDASSTVEVDEEIEELISKIEIAFVSDEYADVVSDYIERIAFLIKKRKSQVREKKSGVI